MTTSLHIPDARTIDYTNVDEICGYQLLLCKIFEREGGFDLPRKTNAAIIGVQAQGQIWLKHVKTIIDSLQSSAVTSSAITLASIPRLLASYDMFYRICNGSPCFDYLRDVKLKTADKWLKGNKTISNTDVILLLLSEADRDIRTLDKRFYTYAISAVGEWIEELSCNGKFIDTQLPEAYRRLAYLLRQDLFVYLDSKEQPKIKARWIKEYTLSDAQLGDLATSDLWSYLAFANTASNLRSNMSDNKLSYEQIITKLASRPDIHPYYRQGIQLDLTYRKSA